MSVTDNGVRTTEAVRACMFEPLFTTKEMGRGAGLGLSSAYAIVTDHGGSISCSSRLGEARAPKRAGRTRSVRFECSQIPRGPNGYGIDGLGLLQARTHELTSFVCRALGQRIIIARNSVGDSAARDP